MVSEYRKMLLLDSLGRFQVMLICHFGTLVQTLLDGRLWFGLLQGGLERAEVRAPVHDLAHGQRLW